MADAFSFATRSLSYKCSCFVLNACGTISDRMREILPYAEEDMAFLSDPEKGGGSSIIGADSMILAGPMSGKQEGLLIADIDLEDCVRAKLVHDYSGHYNRPDVFTLTVNTSVPEIYKSACGAVPPILQNDTEGRKEGDDELPEEETAKVS